MNGPPEFSSPGPSAPVNPYAPSALAEPLDPTTVLGIGIWRSKGQIVIHEDAVFPRLCIQSGQPAFVTQPVKVRWSHWARWPREYFVLRVAMNSRWAYWTGPGSKHIFLLGIAFSLAGLAVAWHGWDLLDRGPFAVALMLFVAACTTIGCWWELKHPLRLVRRRRKYLWLRGAGRKFLEQLPSWPTAG